MRTLIVGIVCLALGFGGGYVAFHDAAKGDVPSISEAEAEEIARDLNGADEARCRKTDVEFSCREYTVQSYGDRSLKLSGQVRVFKQDGKWVGR